MKQLPYGDSSYTFRLELPETWDIESITEVTLGLDSLSGEELLADEAATLYTATTLNGAVSAGGMSITLAGGADAVDEGDRLRIAASASGPHEDVQCDYYDSSGKVVYLTRALNEDHATGAAVYGMFATDVVDLSGSDFTLGLQLWATWTPDTDDRPIKDKFQIANVEYQASDFWNVFAVRFPTEYEAAQARDLEVLEAVYRDEFQQHLYINGINIDRVDDRASIEPGFMRFARLQLLESMGDEQAAEWELARRSWVDWVTEFATKTVVAQDTNMDGAVSKDNEVKIHEPVFFERW